MRQAQTEVALQSSEICAAEVALPHPVILPKICAAAAGNEALKLHCIERNGGAARKCGDGPHTVSESTASNTKRSEFLGPHRVPGSKLSELLSAHYLCAKPLLTEFFLQS